MANLCLSLRREVGQLEGFWCREGSTLLWVVQAEENERMLVGIVV
jgi:hypothetical protein